MDKIPASLGRKVLRGTIGAVLLASLILGGRFVYARSVAAPAPVATGPAAVAPEAPLNSIAFDHSIHAGKYGIPCLFCHGNADKSTTAGLPSTRLCMGCHKFVDKEKPGVVELTRLWDAQQAPRWSRVYDLPDYVYFSHRTHVAAKVECTQCHGNVPSMSRITRVSSLQMGWCLDCHKQRHAPVDCVTCHK